MHRIADDLELDSLDAEILAGLEEMLLKHALFDIYYELRGPR